MLPLRRHRAGAVSHRHRADGSAPRPARGAPPEVDPRRLPVAELRACPLLTPEGRCRVYASRPFGCRTFFCDHAEGPGGQGRRAASGRRDALGRRIADLSARHAPRDPGPRPLVKAPTGESPPEGIIPRRCPASPPPSGRSRIPPRFVGAAYVLGWRRGRRRARRSTSALAARRHARSTRSSRAASAARSAAWASPSSRRPSWSALFSAGRRGCSSPCATGSGTACGRADPSPDGARARRRRGLHGTIELCAMATTRSFTRRVVRARRLAAHCAGAGDRRPRPGRRRGAHVVGLRRVPRGPTLAVGALARPRPRACSRGFFAAHAGPARGGVALSSAGWSRPLPTRRRCGAAGPPRGHAPQRAGARRRLAARRPARPAHGAAPVRRWRARGTRFDRAYVSLPRTFPSWVTLLTGRHPHHHGIRSMFPRWEERARDFDALPERLRARGLDDGRRQRLRGRHLLAHRPGLSTTQRPRVRLPPARPPARARARDAAAARAALAARAGRVPGAARDERRGRPAMLARDAVARCARSRGAGRSSSSSSSRPRTSRTPRPSPYYDASPTRPIAGRYKYDKPVGLEQRRAARRRGRARRCARSTTAPSRAIDDAARTHPATRSTRIGPRKNTIVVVTADHGETLYEHGHGARARRPPVRRRGDARAARRRRPAHRGAPLGVHRTRSCATSTSRRRSTS